MRKASFFLAVAIVIAASCNNNRGYKNVALMKAASHSSAWDLNQTAQLVTYGLLAEKPAPWRDVRLCGKVVSHSALSAQSRVPSGAWTPKAECL